MAECDSCRNGKLDKMEEECGVFAVFSEQGHDVATLTYFGLLALQHRGQESAGICINQQGEFKLHKRMGLVDSVFSAELLKQLKGESAIGHVRYSTTGSSLPVNAQPLLINSIKGDLALAHNGNLINGEELRHNLESHGSIFHSTLDTEVIAHLVARSFEDNLIDALVQSLHQLRGAFSLVALTENGVVGARDPHGFRPLVLGKMEGGWVLSSETAAFELMDAEFVREIEPGELVVINDEGVKSFHYASQRKESFCVFEFIYFARPDSVMAGKNVQLTREAMGRMLAQETNIEADLVIPVPESGLGAALGFAEESGIKYARGIMRNRYVGRTFIQPTQKIRDLSVRLKLTPIRQIIAGKRVILIDDSIVRGTTSKQIINRVWAAGAKEVHMAISSPPVTDSCYYGLDTSKRQELIARQMEISDIASYIGADSLHYLSKEGLLKAVGLEKTGFCTACFDSQYPVGKELVNGEGELDETKEEKGGKEDGAQL